MLRAHSQDSVHALADLQFNDAVQINDAAKQPAKDPEEPLAQAASNASPLQVTNHLSTPDAAVDALQVSKADTLHAAATAVCFSLSCATIQQDLLSSSDSV